MNGHDWLAEYVNTWGLQATRMSTPAGERLVVQDAPIFAECQIGEWLFDEAWVRAAFEHAAFKWSAEGYGPPISVRHHEDPDTTSGPVRRAGFYVPKSLGHIQLEGEERLAIFADLVLSDSAAAFEVEQGLLPYRSVEIPNPTNPVLSGLALLEHEAPFLKFPNLHLASVTSIGAAVPNGKNQPPGLAAREPRGMPVLALGSIDSTSFLAFCEHDAMKTRLRKPAAKPAPGSETPKPGTPAREQTRGQLALAEGEDEPEGEDEGVAAEEGGDQNGAVDSVMGWIEDGSISVDNAKRMVAGLQALIDGNGEGEEQAMEEDEEEQLAPAQTMAREGKRRPTAAELDVRAEVMALRQKDRERDHREARKSAVDGAVARLAGRPLATNFREDAEAVYDEAGAKGFQRWVDSLAKHLGALNLGDDNGAAERFSKTGQGRASKLALCFSEAGEPAVHAAQEAERHYKYLSESGRAKSSREAFVLRYVKGQAPSTKLPKLADLTEAS